MTWQQQVFGPMAERTMENAQRRHLVCCYDLSRDSRLAAAIVAEVNGVLDQEERRRGVWRVRPGELLLRTRRGPLVLGLRTDADLGRVLAGERLEVVRRDILDRCAAAYRGLFPEASAAQVARFLRCVWAGRGPAGGPPAPSTGPAPSGPGRPSRPTPAPAGRRGPSRTPNGACAGPTGTHPGPGTSLPPTQGSPTTWAPKPASPPRCRRP